MIDKVCGYKDRNGNFHDTEYEALRADLVDEIAEHIRLTTYRAADWRTSEYVLKQTAKYIIDRYNLLDRPTVPFWKKII